MNYVGLDVHARQSTFHILDENGKKVATRAVHGTERTVIKELAKIKRPMSICYEASCSYGFLHDQLCAIADHVVVAHPSKLRAIFSSKRKNDRVDAAMLAKLLMLDMVPAVHVPCPDVRAWRRMITHRRSMVDDRTAIKNALRALLRTLGVEAPRSLWSKKGLAWLAGLEFDNTLDAIQRDEMVERLGTLQGGIRRVEDELNKTGRAHPGVALLMTIPGVGPRTAEAAVAYIDDPTRFRNNKTVGAYFGLVPCQDASAAKNRLGHITADGPAVVRRMLTEARPPEASGVRVAWQGIRRSPRIRAYYERIARGKDNRKKIAVVATMHYLIRVMHAMLLNGEQWRAEPARRSHAADRAA